MTAETHEHGIEERPLLRQMLSYGVIGLTTASLDTATFWLLITYTVLPPQIANIISVSLGISTSFVLNRMFTFRAQDKALKRFLTFFAVGLFGLALSAAILEIGVRAGLTPIVSKVLAVGFVAVVQFILNRTVTFRASRSHTHAAR